MIKLKDILFEQSGPSQQKDFLAYKRTKGNLFWVSIINEGDERGWRLIEFGNHFGLAPQNFANSLQEKLSRMNQAAKLNDVYKYTTGGHTFKKKRIDTPFWKEIIPDALFWQEATVDEGIDREQVEWILYQLIQDIDYEALYKNGKKVKEKRYTR